MRQTGGARTQHTGPRTTARLPEQSGSQNIWDTSEHETDANCGWYVIYSYVRVDF